MKKIDEYNYEISSLDELKDIQKEIGSKEVGISINFVNDEEDDNETEDASFKELLDRYYESAKEVHSKYPEEK